MHEAGKSCTELIEKTAYALNDNVVSVMLIAVQKGNLELSIYVAVTKSVFSYRMAWINASCTVADQGQVYFDFKNAI